MYIIYSSMYSLFFSLYFLTLDTIFSLSDTSTYRSRHVLVYHSQYWQTVEGSAAGNLLTKNKTKNFSFSSEWTKPFSSNSDDDQGRKELLSLLKRKRHKEMFLSELEKKRLRYSPLDMRFHIRDLIGSAHLKIFQTTSGLVVRVSND